MCMCVRECVLGVGVGVGGGGYNVKLIGHHFDQNFLPKAMCIACLISNSKSSNILHLKNSVHVVVFVI